MRKIKLLFLCLVLETSSYGILYSQVCSAYYSPKWIGSYKYKICAKNIYFFGSNNWTLKFGGSKELRNIKPSRKVHIVTTVLRGVVEHFDRTNILLPYLRCDAHLLFPDTVLCFKNVRSSVILRRFFIAILFHLSLIKC
jgi:hypothetical protein